MIYEFVCRLIAENKKSTISALYLSSPGKIEYICAVLEEGTTGTREAGELRIQEGRFPMKKQSGGDIATAYKKKFDWHDGVFLLEVPGRSGIIPHIGNYVEEDAAGKPKDNSRGCPLLNSGYARGPKGFFYGLVSEAAYKRWWEVADKLYKEGHELFWRVDRGLHV